MGLVLIDKMAEALGVCPSIDEKLGRLKRRDRGYRVSEKVMELVRLYVSGGDVISDIRQLSFIGGIYSYRLIMTNMG